MRQYEPEKIISVSHLSKSYGKVKAVSDVSFYVEAGKLFAFLGPNGAGKSTTINTICTFLKPDEGEVIVNGNQLGKADDKIRSSIGVVFQENLLDELLTVEENLLLRGGFYGMEKRELKEAVQRVTEDVRLGSFIKRPYGKLSGGQKRRADIARALIHTPEILFLDEPTTGLDPQTRKNMWDIIKGLQKERGMTVFLTTHYMEEAEEADYCIVVDEGKIAAKGTPFELKERYAADRLLLKGKQPALLEAELEQRKMRYKKAAEIFEIELEDTMAALPVLNELKDYLQDFSVIKGTMDDVFIGITGKEIRE